MEELRRVLRGVDSSNVVSQGIGGGGDGGVLRMMNSHSPYKHEYLGSLTHLRGFAGIEYGGCTGHYKSFEPAVLG
jgi:hypothetical protein